jgi:sterol desaturase/sphingolipid hydroxylase (fatty acid hydroxylase superfamily)
MREMADSLIWLEALAAGLGALFFLFLPFELWQRRRAGLLTWASAKEMAANVGVFVPGLLAGGLVLAFVVGLFTVAASVSPWEIATTPLTAVLCVLLVDLLYYWDHRTVHRVRVLWAISHSVHHSSPNYDQTTALRVSVLDGAISPWFYLPAVLIGFDPLLVVAAFGLVLAYQQWLHTESIGRLGWIDSVFNTPSNHRVHHGVEGPYIDKNYGAILIVWDRLFGTWARETVRPTYGLVEPIASSHIWTVHIAEARRLWADLRREKRWSERLDMLFGPPEGKGAREGGA